MEINTIGVVGCGLMGSGIAEVAARRGYQVIVSEANDALLTQGLDRIRASLTKAVSRGKATQGEMDEALLSRCSMSSKTRCTRLHLCSSAWCWPDIWGSRRGRAFTTTRSSQPSVFSNR